MTSLRLIRVATWLLVAVLALGTGYLLWARAPAAGSSAGSAAIGGPFALTTASGERVSEAILRGRAHALFFGYTHCPDVCPTTLADLSVMLGDLGPDAGRIDVYFVTVDPERDTPAVLADYLSAFDPRIVGLTGSEADVDRMTSEYRVFRKKVPGENGDYAMDHTAAVFLFGPDGAFRGTIGYGEDRTDAEAKLKRLAEG